MRKDSWNAVAIDCGNSSVRTLLGVFDGAAIKTTLIEQTPHREILVNGVWHWDILYIFECIKRGLKKAHALAGRIDSAGIATWGIDHGLFAEGGFMLANPLCYRNVFGQEGMARLTPEERRFMFDNTGIQCDRINSVFQMLGYRERFPEYWRSARRILLIPDLLNFLLTGEENSDASIASTTQLFDVATNRYADAILEKFDLDKTLFPPVVPHGQIRGTLRRDIADELGVNRFPVVSVPAHDTAAAVAAIPTDETEGRPLFVSSGTWSLVGVELEKPIVNDAVFASGLANEAGILGTITLLKNSAGLFIAQRLKLECDQVGNEKTWDEIVGAIDPDDGRCPVFDPNDEKFFNPPSMRETVAEAIGESGQSDPVRLFRAVYESLAGSYRDAVAVIENLSGGVFPVLHIIGGGGRNELLNRLAARATGKTVVAGPVEATSLGNLGAQLLFEGSVRNLADIRRIARASCEVKIFKPE